MLKNKIFSPKVLDPKFLREIDVEDPPKGII